MAGAKLLELIGLNPEFDRLTAQLNQYADLKDLSEETIFIEYEAGRAPVFTHTQDIPDEGQEGGGLQPRGAAGGNTGNRGNEGVYENSP